jgi:hypothetical protein
MSSQVRKAKRETQPCPVLTVRLEFGLHLLVLVRVTCLEALSPAPKKGAISI